MVGPHEHDDGPSACAVLGSRSGVVEYAGHPCCYAVSAGKCLLTFRRCITTDM